MSNSSIYCCAELDRPRDPLLCRLGREIRYLPSFAILMMPAFDGRPRHEFQECTKGPRKDFDSLPAFQSVGVVDESNVGSSAGAWLLDRVDDVGTDLFVAFQL